jgi:hypothetical protein
VSAFNSVPVCEDCWQGRFGVKEPMPAATVGLPAEQCGICGRDTDAGLYLLRGARRERQDRSLRVIWRQMRHIVNHDDDVR